MIYFSVNIGCNSIELTNMQYGINKLVLNPSIMGIIQWLRATGTEFPITILPEFTLLQTVVFVARLGRQSSQSPRADMTSAVKAPASLLSTAASSPVHTVSVFTPEGDTTLAVTFEVPRLILSMSAFAVIVHSCLCL